ncbi:MAG: helix-turn-helix domain-containing protein [Candidatus Sedimenticola sp. (ex Thyasira tokunagai)]
MRSQNVHNNSAVYKSEVKIVFDRLKDGPLTKIQAFDELAIFTLAQRIHELRKSGYDIRSEMIPIETAKGLRQIAEYTLISEGVNHA